MSTEVQHYYDEFSKRFIRDYVRGNARVERQLRFFANAIPETVRSVLVIGCGSGQGAHFVATRVAKQARVLAVDVSPVALAIAQQLFPHRRIEYRQADVTKDDVDGRWDVVLLPDVYEHIPAVQWPAFNAKLAELMGDGGRVLLTVPSPGLQASLKEAGEGLQVVDETVTQEDLKRLADTVGGQLTYYCLVSVWRTNDYIHGLIERNATSIEPLDSSSRLAVKGGRCSPIIPPAVTQIARIISPGRLYRWLRVRTRLGRRL